VSDLKVSVVVPARNAAAWLGECLESIRSQHPYELIVVDGCSTDDTAEIARDCGATVISDEGRGLPAARMLGARSATGDVVALIDADVVLPPKSLPRLLAEFVHNLPVIPLDRIQIFSVLGLLEINARLAETHADVHSMVE